MDTGWISWLLSGGHGLFVITELVTDMSPGGPSAFRNSRLRGNMNRVYCGAISREKCVVGDVFLCNVFNVSTNEAGLEYRGDKSSSNVSFGQLSNKRASLVHTGGLSQRF